MEAERFQIYLIIVLAIVAMLIMGGAIVVFVVFYQKKMIREQLKRHAIEAEYQQKMLKAELESQESERRRLAADMHDSIGGMLSTIRVGLTTIARSLPKPEMVDETKKMLDDTISSVRRISRDLLPSTLEKFGFVHAIQELCERFQATSTIPITLNQVGELPPLESTRRLMMFRIVQELLNNAIKHAQADHIQVTIAADELLSIVIEDDGVGFDADAIRNSKQNGKGLGLFNIENRARLIGAHIDFEKGRRKGSKTVITVPLTDEKTA